MSMRTKRFLKTDRCSLFQEKKMRCRVCVCKRGEICAWLLGRKMIRRSYRPPASTRQRKLRNTSFTANVDHAQHFNGRCPLSPNLGAA